VTSDARAAIGHEAGLALPLSQALTAKSEKKKSNAKPNPKAPAKKAKKARLARTAKKAKWSQKVVAVAPTIERLAPSGELQFVTPIENL
jgi:hypothetical protein